jgi:hypothetical protein
MLESAVCDGLQDLRLEKERGEACAVHRRVVALDWLVSGSRCGFLLVILENFLILGGKVFHEQLAV